MKKFTLLFLLFSVFAVWGQTTDASGRKQGYWKKKDEKTNKVMYEGMFKDDKPQGKFKYYYPTDSVRAVLHFRNDGKAAYAWLFHLNGKRAAEGKYVNKDTRDSIWTFYDEGGVLISRETYKAGVKEGASYVYLPDGTLSEEKFFKNNLQDGPFKQYFDGKAIRSQGKYVKGQMEGRVSYHYPNGVEAAAGFYKNGVKNGPWIYKSQKGDVTERELYKNGNLASEKETKEFFNKNSQTPAPEKKPAPEKNPPAGKKPAAGK